MERSTKLCVRVRMDRRVVAFVCEQCALLVPLSCDHTRGHGCMLDAGWWGVCWLAIHPQVMYPEHIDGYDLSQLDISEFLNPPTPEEVRQFESPHDCAHSLSKHSHARTHARTHASIHACIEERTSRKEGDDLAAT